jgi:tRNA nucleotidyltransferase (CCA-adding enzyme)
VDAARGFLTEPSIEYFFAEPEHDVDKSEIIKVMKARETDLLAIVFEMPDMVEDIVYPQLYKMEDSVLSLLTEHEFTVFGSAVSALSAGEATINVVLLLELVSGRLPTLAKHVGPPVYMRKHAERFKSKFTGEDTFSDVYIENGRYIVDIRRKYTSAKRLLESKLHSCALGKQLREFVSLGYAVLEGEETTYAVSPEFLKMYFGK